MSHVESGADEGQNCCWDTIVGRSAIRGVHVAGDRDGVCKRGFYGSGKGEAPPCAVCLSSTSVSERRFWR